MDYTKLEQEIGYTFQDKNLLQTALTHTSYAYERKTISTSIIQNLVLENRQKLSISGVNDVLSFDDQVVVLETELGLLTVKGENLRVNKLSIDTSEVVLEGEISYLAYTDKDSEKNKNSSLLSKIFK